MDEVLKRVTLVYRAPETMIFRNVRACLKSINSGEFLFRIGDETNNNDFIFINFYLNSNENQGISKVLDRFLEDFKQALSVKNKLDSLFLTRLSVLERHR